MLEEHPVKKLIVFRYLSQKHIDEFFESGRLRLSAFSEFAKHKDEQRFDAQEGWLIVDIHGKGQRLMARAGVGFDAYILSTSLRGNAELMNVFGTDGYFKINDADSFAVAVADRITSCAGGLAGSCIYANEREIHQRMGELLDRAIERNEQGKMNLMRVVQLIKVALVPEAYFWKLLCHAHQQEFRFVWHVGHKVNEPLFIECPEALQFCEKVT